MLRDHWCSGPAPFLAVFALLLALAAPRAMPQPAAKDPAPAPADPPKGLGLFSDPSLLIKGELTPGKEIKIDDPATGGLGYWLLYVPSDYTDARPFPLIVCLHGLNQNPQTSPFRANTGGKGFIIVGYEYLDRDLSPKSPTPGKTYDQAESANLQRVLLAVGARLKVNPKMLFLGGFSQGGWRTNSLAHSTPDLFAGLLILGAGGSPGKDAGKEKVWAGKPIFIAAGEKCPNNPAAKEAVASYQAAGATVTFEEWKGLGHAYNDKCPVMRAWLLDNGPLKQVKADLSAARAAEKAGKLGPAYRLYHAVAQNPLAGAEATAAAAAAKAIDEKSQQDLAAAQEPMQAGKYGPATVAMLKLAALYEGTPAGQTAKQESDRLRNDPTVKAAIAQADLNARAGALEARAQAAEDAKDYAQALELYDLYCRTFAAADRSTAVQAHLAALKSDPAIASGVGKQKADHDCKEWLNLADAYLSANRTDLAKPLLEKITATYPATDWAAKAKDRLDKLK